MPNLPIEDELKELVVKVARILIGEYKRDCSFDSLMAIMHEFATHYKAREAELNKKLSEKDARIERIKISREQWRELAKKAIRSVN